MTQFVAVAAVLIGVAIRLAIPVLLTILIVFLFLGSWRSTVITGLTLPIATIGTFLFMYMFGFTLNMLTLMALSLCIGLLIDDAIVVRENIVRHGAMGKPHRDAALDGTQEIGLAVLATTLSIVAVFAPVGLKSKREYCGLAAMDRPVASEFEYGLRSAAKALRGSWEVVIRKPYSRSPPCTLALAWRLIWKE